MSLVQDIINDFRSTRLTRKEMLDEDRVSTLAVNEAHGYRLPISYANDAVVLSDKGAWTGFEIPAKRWGFLDKETAAAYIESADQVFSNAFPAERGSQGHLLITNQVHSSDEWEQEVVAQHADTALPTFAPYIRATREAINAREFFERDTYLFVRLGDRRPRGVRGILRSGMEYIMLSAGIEDTQPDQSEVAGWVDAADDMAQTLSASWLTARPINRRRVEWLVRNIDTPGLPTPATVEGADREPWGIGWWRTVLSSYTRRVDLGREESRGPRYSAIEFDSPVGEGRTYAAFLPLATIPTKIAQSSNWLHHAAALDFPVDVSLRFEILNQHRTSKAIQRPINAVEDQAEEDAAAGISPDEASKAQYAGLQDANKKFSIGGQRMARWQAVFCVYDTDKQELRSKIARLTQHYKGIRMDLVNPTFDQRELFYQSFPGGEIEVDDWIHKSDTLFLANAQPWLASSVGDADGTGLYQGYTIVQDSGGSPERGTPVFYDLLNVVDVEKQAPTEAVAADSGGGKTVSRGLKSAFEDMMRGFTQFIWDPKGDFLALVRYAKELRIDPSKIKLVDLLDPSASLSLDPFGTAEVNVDNTDDPKDERTAAAVDALTTLLKQQLRSLGEGRIVGEQLLRAAVRRELAKEAGLPLEDVIRIRESGEERSIEEEPCLQGVLASLEEWSEEGSSPPVTESYKDQARFFAATLADPLRARAQATLGKHLFRRPSTGGSLNIRQGDLVLFVAINMVTTEKGEEQSERTALPDVIAGMMTNYIRSMLYTLPNRYIKSATFDEWHVIKRSGSADSLVQWLRRMGRSKRCMVRQMSQSALDFYDPSDPESSKVSLSTVWCGKVSSETEAKASCSLLGIEQSQSNIRLLMNLAHGQFLFRDASGRVAYVQIEFVDDRLLDWFKTDAESKQESLLSG